MINLIKADLYKIRHSKITIALPIILICLITMMCGLFAAVKYIMASDITADIFGSMSDIADLGSLNMSGIIVNSGYDMTIMNLQSDSLIYCFLGILILVSTFDFSSGTIRNYLSFGKTKAQIYFSKMITSCIFAAIMVVIYGVLSIVISYTIFGRDIQLKDFIDLIFIAIKQIPIYVSVITIGTMFVFITQRTLSAILLFIGSFMLTEMIVPMIDIIVDWPFKFNLLFPLYQLIDLTNTSVNTSNMIVIYLVSFLSIVFSVMLGYSIFKKAEIK